MGWIWMIWTWWKQSAVGSKLFLDVSWGYILRNGRTWQGCYESIEKNRMPRDKKFTWQVVIYEEGMPEEDLKTRKEICAETKIKVMVCFIETSLNKRIKGVDKHYSSLSKIVSLLRAV